MASVPWVLEDAVEYEKAILVEWKQGPVVWVKEWARNSDIFAHNGRKMEVE